MSHDFSVSLHITNKTKPKHYGFCSVKMLVGHRLGRSKSFSFFLSLFLTPLSSPNLFPCLQKIATLSSSWAASRSSSGYVGRSVNVISKCLCCDIKQTLGMLLRIKGSTVDSSWSWSWVGHALLGRKEVSLAGSPRKAGDFGEKTSSLVGCFHGQLPGGCFPEGGRLGKGFHVYKFLHG